MQPLSLFNSSVASRSCLFPLLSEHSVIRTLAAVQHLQFPLLRGSTPHTGLGKPTSPFESQGSKHSSPSEWCATKASTSLIYSRQHSQSTTTHDHDGDIQRNILHEQRPRRSHNISPAPLRSSATDSHPIYLNLSQEYKDKTPSLPIQNKARTEEQK